MISIAVDEALQMLQAGWTVRYNQALDSIEWRSPDGMSGSASQSTSLDHPPITAVNYARERGHIIERHRRAPL